MIAAIALLGSHTFAAPVEAPMLDPDGGNLPAPLKVKVRSTTPQAMVHVTLDGQEPTQRDMEVDSDIEIVIDQPLTLKAKAWLPDGSVSATKTAAYSLVPVQGNGASLVGQNVPVLMLAGNPHRVAVTFRNIGNVPWTSAVHALAPYRPKDAQVWNIGPSPVAANTPTWSDATFKFTVTGPAAPGTYNLRFRMQSNGQAFGEPTPTLRVEVLTLAEFERETRAVVELVTDDASTRRKTGSKNPAPAARAPVAPLDKEQTAALAEAMAQSGPALSGEIERLVRELQRSGRSFRYLRTIGFNHSDDDFTKIIAPHPELFRSTRIVRRDDKGQRIIPGWPGVALANGGSRN